MLKLLLSQSRKKKVFILAILDFILSLSSYYAAIYLRFEKIFLLDISQYLPFLLSILIYFSLFFFTKIHRNINRVNNINYLYKIFIIFNVYGLLFFLSLLLFEFENFPRSVGVIQPLIFLILALITRILYIAVINEFHTQEKKKPTLILFSNLDYFINSLVDLNINKNHISAYIDLSEKNIKRQIDNIKIHSFKDCKNIIKKFKIKNILVQTDKLDENDKKNIFNELFKLNLRVNSLESVKNSKIVKKEKSLDINLFLKRNIKINYEKNRNDFKNANILITGAGGSIGQELCTQILLYDPKKLILFDHSEYNLYNINENLINLSIRNNIKTEIIPILGCIKDKIKINNIFQTHKLDKVFHAAAYKHVNMVEKNYLAALENNFFGTVNLLNAANEFSVKKFTLISTDKSVNPTNYMGVTKRLSEMAIESFASAKTKTIFSAVRFGNVIDSSGSVIPLFRKQINNGGPITVTDPNVKRYFMLISEAVSLVLNADLMSSGGEIFTLNMGNQHKILDLANLMIKSNGLLLKDRNNPDGDIEIIFVGLKKGEKIEEELNYNSTKLLQTENENIFKTKTRTLTKEEFDTMIEEIYNNKQDLSKLDTLFKKNIEGYSI